MFYRVALSFGGALYHRVCAYCFSSPYHQRMHVYYGLVFINLTREDENSAYCSYRVLNRPKEKIRIRAVNEPEEAISIQEINQRALEIFNASSRCIHQQFREDVDLKSGVCSGITQAFCIEYLEWRKKGTVPLDAADFAALTHADGGDFKACLLHVIYSRLESSSIDALCFSCKVGGADVVSVTNYSPLFEEQRPLMSCFKDEGVYYISASGHISNWNDPTMSEIKETSGHGIGLIVEAGCYLIFDPNQGLWQTTDPCSYLTPIVPAQNDVLTFLQLSLADDSQTYSSLLLERGSQDLLHPSYPRRAASPPSSSSALPASH
ncbi:MAG: hypothetical protein S4CHLAM81_05420 [Chlamydiales bacterium]|nr:hypothetical protein [Chlamydiales bacterium]MCH9635328.1 hypothetical protein [Chlamydiales bacterium]